MHHHTHFNRTTTFIPKTEKVEDDITETEKESGKDGFNVVDSVFVGAATVGVFLGNVLKAVRVLPVVP